MENTEHHKEPEKPLVYEPTDLKGRQHVAKGNGLLLHFVPVSFLLKYNMNFSLIILQ